MKILIVSQHYYPEQFTITDICEELNHKGHDVTVLTGLPNYPGGTVPKEYKWFKHRKETINGVKVIRCFEIGRKHGLVHLALNYLSFFLSSCTKALFLKGDYDVVYTYSLSPILSAYAAVLYKKLHKKKLLLYCLDIWPESLKSIGMQENNLIFKVMKKISRCIYRGCDRIAVTSTPFINYLHDLHGIPDEKVTYLPQYADESLLHMDLKAEKNADVDFVFMGNVGRVQDVDCIVDAVELIQDTDHFKVHIVGEGSMLEEIKVYTDKKNLNDRILFHGRYPVEEMPKFYKLADACLLTLSAESLIGETVPGKLQGYMAAGKPVIAAINGAAQDIIRTTCCGICVNSGDSEGLAGIMREFIQNHEQYKALGMNGQEYFKNNFTKDIYIQKLENLLFELIGG